VRRGGADAPPKRSEARGQVSRSESCPPSEARGEDARGASVRGRVKSAEGSFHGRSAGEAHRSEAILRSEVFLFRGTGRLARGRPRRIFHARRGARRGGPFWRGAFLGELMLSSPLPRNDRFFFSPPKRLRMFLFYWAGGDCFARREGAPPFNKGGGRRAGWSRATF
jgi:hypothetical protein